MRKVWSRTFKGGKNTDAVSTYEEAEKVHGEKLDKRKNYCIMEGLVFELCRWSSSCSGCDEGYEYGGGNIGCGCSECGYTGMRRHSQWVPLDGEKYFAQRNKDA